jgi:hypothetical protein
LPLLLLPLSTYAQKSNDSPLIPYADHGACPFECCTYRRWVANKETILRKDRRDDSPVAFKVRKGERVTAVTGVVITTEPGQARLLKPIAIADKRARIGDVVYLLTDLGEGFCKVWYKGKMTEAEVYTDEATFRIVSEPKSVWWVKIKNSKGQIGWSRQAENFDNKDACG